MQHQVPPPAMTHQPGSRALGLCCSCLVLAAAALTGYIHTMQPYILRSDSGRPTQGQQAAPSNHVRDILPVQYSWRGGMPFAQTPPQPLSHAMPYPVSTKSAISMMLPGATPPYRTLWACSTIQSVLVSLMLSITTANISQSLCNSGHLPQGRM
jgi:hypothetical protein